VKTINGIERLPPDLAIFFSYRVLLNKMEIGMSTKTHYKDTSTAVRASMAHFNAVLKANFFFGTYTQPENFMSLNYTESTVL
jgi:hypothetical protein